nr:microtubule-associated protein futsch-like [Ipomoea batatas]
MSSNSSSSIASSVPNYLRPTTASSAVQAAGDKPSPARRKSLDRPLSHLDTHRNLAGDKPSPARRKSLDRPIQPLHSPLSSPSSSCSSTSSLPYKPTFSRTKSSLDRPKSSTAMSRTSEANDRRGKIMTRSISSVSKSSSIAHNHHLKTTPNKTQKNSTRKQPGNTTLSSKPIKKKTTETILTANHPHEPSVPILQSPDHHKTEASATPNSNQTEINNNNNNSKIVQEKENIIVVVSSDHEELEDLKSIEDCSSLSSVLEDPPIDPVDTITEEGDAEAISVPENLQESGQTQSADTIPHTTPEDPKVEDKAGGEINNLKETTPADPKPADEVSVEEKGDETMHDNNCKANKPALKRNESVVSNDVIEETASKLREQRKNKVKALAGAFETVISLQDK